MVLRTKFCRFNGARIYPGIGIIFVRGDMQFFRVVSSKCKRYFCNCIKPAKHTRVAIYRNYHKKSIHDEIVKRRRCARKRPFSKSSVVAVFEVIQKKRIEKFEVCDTIKEASLRSTMDSGMKIVDFGDDVLEQILGRLPDVSLPFVTMVCKRFRSLICSPSFHYARTYLRVVGLPCIVIVSLPDYHMACIPSEACPSSFLPQLSLFPDSKFKGEDLSMCTSAAGLFYYFLKGSSHPYSHVLFNPVTGEIQHTPSPYSVLYFLHEVGALGLAVEPSASPVLVACVGNPCRFIFTYSFPSSTWRHARVELCLCDAIINNTVAAYCNGALHWLHGSWYSRGGIIAFNVASNFAYRLSLPEGVKVADFRPPNVWLGAIGGRLVAVLIENADVVVWAMEDYGENAWWKKNVLKSVETIEEVQRRLQITKVAPLFYGEGRCLAYAWDGKRRDARMLLVYSEETRIWSCIRRVSGHQLKLLRFIPATMVLSDFRRMSFKLQ